MNRKHERKLPVSYARPMVAAIQSLDDLLPPGATFEIDPDGTVRIYMATVRGKEGELAADIAKRLNIDVDQLEIAKHELH